MLIRFSVNKFLVNRLSVVCFDPLLCLRGLSGRSLLFSFSVVVCKAK